MRREILVKVLIVVVGLLLLSSSNAWAGRCIADSNCDRKVNLTDLKVIKSEEIELTWINGERE